MSVTLRRKGNKDGTTSLYLDIFHNGKRQYQFLKELKLIKPTNPIERQRNKENLETAERIRNKRAVELESIENLISPSFKKKVDFIEYFQAFIDKYAKKDRRVIISALSKFKEFLKESRIKNLTANMVDEILVSHFKDYLETHLNGESPANYFKKFKKVLKQATRERIFLADPSIDVTITRKESVKKDILMIEEIGLLARTPMTNQDVKRAFLFSCYTGLRWCDVEAITWKNVDLKSNVISIVQQKTSERVTLNLHPSAIQALGKSGKPNEKIFSLPSHTAALKGIRIWVRKAGITKNITWHCARHSFATNIIYHGADVNTASSLLGHTSLKYTQRYTHIVNSLKERAIANLPTIKIEDESERIS